MNMERRLRCSQVTYRPFDALSLAHGKPFRREEANRRDSGLVRSASNGQLDVTQDSYGSASIALSKRQRVERARI
jgi:hypothetical protein